MSLTPYQKRNREFLETFYTFNEDVDAWGDVTSYEGGMSSEEKMLRQLHLEIDNMRTAWKNLISTYEEHSEPIPEWVEKIKELIGKEEQEEELHQTKDRLGNL